MDISPALVAELLALGVVAGFLAGLLGVGGGMMMVPVLTLVLTQRGVAGGLAVKMAIATSMATIMFTSLSSVRVHHGLRNVRWAIVRSLAPGILLGGLLAGAGAFAMLKGQALALGFAAFVSYMGTSAALGFPIALASTAGYVVSGWSQPPALPGAVGYLYLPALALVSLASVSLAPLGARATQRLNVAVLKRLFAVLLLGLAVSMLIRAFST